MGEVTQQVRKCDVSEGILQTLDAYATSVEDALPHF